MSEGIDRVTNARATLDAWRERGSDRIDPMRFRIIDALAQRASRHEGDTRRVLDARLSSLIDAYARDVERAGLHDETRRVDAAPSPLAALLDDLAKHAGTHRQPAELLDYLRAVWSKVSAEKRLRESLAQVPKNAGPLNSSSLVHRALSLMREVSPDYLEHFLSHLDALAWMEELTRPPAPAVKTSRGKRA